MHQYLYSFLLKWDDPLSRSLTKLADTTNAYCRQSHSTLIEGFHISDRYDFARNTAIEAFSIIWTCHSHWRELICEDWFENGSRLRTNQQQGWLDMLNGDLRACQFHHIRSINQQNGGIDRGQPAPHLPIIVLTSR